MLNWLNSYISSPVHTWWVDKIWRPSWTRLVAFVYGIPALVTVVFQQLASWANDSTFAGYIDKLHVPNWVPMAFAGIALTQYIAHGRPANETT